MIIIISIIVMMMMMMIVIIIIIIIIIFSFCWNPWKKGIHNEIYLRELGCVWLELDDVYSYIIRPKGGV